MKRVAPAKMTLMALTDDQKLDIHRRYADAVNAGAVETVLALLAPGATTWHNFDDVTAPLADAFKGLGWMHKNVAGLRWETRKVRATPDGFVWEAVIRGTAPHGELAAHTCMVVHLDGAGLITELDEYIDPAAMKPLRG